MERLISNTNTSLAATVLVKELSNLKILEINSSMHFLMHTNHNLHLNVFTDPVRHHLAQILFMRNLHITSSANICRSNTAALIAT